MMMMITNIIIISSSSSSIGIIFSFYGFAKLLFDAVPPILFSTSRHWWQVCAK